jgi:hypothetical protein
VPSNNTNTTSGSNSSGNQLLADLASQLSAARTIDATEALTAQIDRLRAVAQIQANIIADNTKAVTSNTSTQASSGGSSGVSAVNNALSKYTGGVFSLSPLISGLAKLFGGGGPSTPPPLQVYTAPEAVQFEGEVTRSTNTTDWSGSEGTKSGTPVVPSAPQITVQVSAMDSRSFLDHSQEIARAVRDAMLNSHSLNDVVNDL